jgi:FAD/FMN-containing dehydrogenase
MVLLGDIVGDDETPWPAPPARWCASPIHARARASSPSAPTRARSSGSTASAPPPSARHTNAFKVNEDVVIPLPRMGEYTDGIERINIELSLRNKLALVMRCRPSSQPRRSCRWAAGRRRRIPSAELLEDRVQQALALLAEVRALWQFWLDNLDVVQATAAMLPRAAGLAPARQSWKTQILKPLQQLFAGQRLRPVLDECRAIHKEVLRGRVWVALHMHAGDGNVHTNIPVNSDNYAMLQTAHEAVARIMALAQAWAA